MEKRRHVCHPTPSMLSIGGAIAAGKRAPRRSEWSIQKPSARCLISQRGICGWLSTPESAHQARRSAGKVATRAEHDGLKDVVAMPTHAYPHSSGGFLCDMRTNQELDHDAAEPQRLVA